MRKFIALTAASLTALAVAAGPVSADSTTVTFAVTSSGTLSVSDPVTDPATHTLGSGSFDAASTGFATGALPTVTVTDNRNPTLGGWTVAVGTTQFKSATNQAGTTTPLHTIAGSNVSYWSGAATVASGTVVAVGQQLAEAGAVTLSQSRDAVVATGAVGNNSVTFTPSLKVNISGVPVDTYTGVITHSVTGS